jgi:SnoaL-like domain
LACPSWRWMMLSATPSRASSSACAWRSWCGAKRRLTPARTASRERARAYFEEIRRASRENFDTESAISRMAEFWDPEIEWDTRGAPAAELAGLYVGVESARRWCRAWFDAWEALHFEYELVDAGQRVVTLLDLRMRGRSSGIEVAFGRHAWVTRFRDGLMVHNKLYMSQAKALEAVGLSERGARP